jgi:ATP-dependent helicase YprA (DUF1998 family)
MCDRPTRAELEAEEWEEQVRKEAHRCLMEENEWYHRANGVVNLYGKAKTQHGSFIKSLIGRIEDMMEELREEIEEDTGEALADACAYERNPMKYYGLSHKDFL